MSDNGAHHEHFSKICNPHLQRIDAAIEKQTALLSDHDRSIVRLSQVDNIIESHTDTLRLHTEKLNGISEKVFNGFGDTVESVNTKLDIEIRRNDEEFRRINDTLSAIVKFGATSVILIFVALLGVIGSIWVSDRSALREIQIIQTEQTRARADTAPYTEDRDDSTRDTTEQGR